VVGGVFCFRWSWNVSFSLTSYLGDFFLFFLLQIEARLVPPRLFHFLIGASQIVEWTGPSLLYDGPFFPSPGTCGPRPILLKSLYRIPQVAFSPPLAPPCAIRPSFSPWIPRTLPGKVYICAKSTGPPAMAVSFTFGLGFFSDLFFPPRTMEEDLSILFSCPQTPWTLSQRAVAFHRLDLSFFPFFSSSSLLLSSATRTALRRYLSCMVDLFSVRRVYNARASSGSM